MKSIALREHWETGRVEIWIYGNPTGHLFDTYSRAAEHIKWNYSLDDKRLLEIYKDYRDDYDKGEYDASQRG